ADRIAVATLQVAHDIPGRLRLRLRAFGHGDSLAADMRAHPGVTDCTWVARTGSLLLHYRPEETTGAFLRDAVAARTGLSPGRARGSERRASPAGRRHHPGGDRAERPGGAGDGRHAGPPHPRASRTGGVGARRDLPGPGRADGLVDGPLVRPRPVPRLRPARQ